VIVLSACSEREFGPKARAAGCARYLEKPARPVQVLHEVEALIGRPPPPGVGRPPLEHPAVA
jgi:DNA-binding response OmpR family regulator